MAKNLTLKQVISDLNEAGYNIVFENGKYRSQWKHDGAYGPYYYTERELYNLHKDQFKKGRSYKKIIKKLTNGKDRAAKRDMINTGDFDKIPNNKRIKTEDPWSYD